MVIIRGRKYFSNSYTGTVFLSKGHFKQFVLVQLNLAIIIRFIFNSSPRPTRVAPIILRFAMFIFLQSKNIVANNLGLRFSCEH